MCPQQQTKKKKTARMGLALEIQKEAEEMLTQCITLDGPMLNAAGDTGRCSAFVFNLNLWQPFVSAPSFGWRQAACVMLPKIGWCIRKCC